MYAMTGIMVKRNPQLLINCSTTGVLCIDIKKTVCEREASTAILTGGIFVKKKNVKKNSRYRQNVSKVVNVGNGISNKKTEILT